jgi:hypothetical protein
MIALLEGAAAALMARLFSPRQSPKSSLGFVESSPASAAKDSPTN